MNGIQKTQLFYRHTPDAPLHMQEFGFFTLDKWKSQGYISDDTDLNELFGFDESGVYSLGGLGWCEAPLCPWFEEEVIEDRGKYEVVRDVAGRHVLYFKGRRNGFMPEYIDHPVKDMYTWEKNVKWRMDPDNPDRFKDTDRILDECQAAADKGKIICQRAVGGYMYLRSLIGPEQLL